MITKGGIHQRQPSSLSGSAAAWGYQFWQKFTVPKLYFAHLQAKTTRQRGWLFILKAQVKTTCRVAGLSMKVSNCLVSFSALLLADCSASR